MCKDVESKRVAQAGRIPHLSPPSEHRPTDTLGFERGPRVTFLAGALISHLQSVTPVFSPL